MNPGLTLMQTDSRVQSIEVKIKKLDTELGRYKEQMSKVWAERHTCCRDDGCIAGYKGNRVLERISVRNRLT